MIWIGLTIEIVKSFSELSSNCPTPEDIVNINTQKLYDILTEVKHSRINLDKVSDIQNIAKNSFGIKFALDGFTFEYFQQQKQLKIKLFLKKVNHVLKEYFLFQQIHHYYYHIIILNWKVQAIKFTEIYNVNLFTEY